MTNHNFQLTDKIALVTGGAGLLGSAICKALSEANAKVYITDIDDKKWNLLCEKLRNNGLNVKYHNLDINSKLGTFSECGHVFHYNCIFSGNNPNHYYRYNI